MEINFNTLRHACKYQSFSCKGHKDCDFDKALVETFFCDNKKNPINKCLRAVCPLNANKEELEKDVCKLCDNNNSKPLFCKECEQFK